MAPKLHPVCRSLSDESRGHRGSGALTPCVAIVRSNHSFLSVASAPYAQPQEDVDVDPARVAVAGGSQGGGISLAAARLIPDLPATYWRRCRTCRSVVTSAGRST